MAKFIEDRSSLKKKKKKETTTQKVAAPSSANKKQVSNVANQVVNRTANAAKRTTNTVGNSAQRQNTVRRNVQSAVSQNAPQRYNNRPSGSAQPSTNHTVQDRLAASRQRREQAEADIKRRRQEAEARSQRVSQSRNPRMQDTARGTKMPTVEERRQKQDRLRQAQEQKMGNNSMASKEAQRTANRALKNTPTVAKESAKQVAIGHGKTFADLTEANKSAAIGSKIDIKSKEFQEDIEKRRKESTRVAKSSFKTLSDMQEKSEQKLQQTTKDAKGLEKAYYGALESGVGMATDRLAGPAWAVSMLSRTYGNTRGQAQKEGATEDEDRAYSLLQAAKEVATEYMFQGVGLAKGLSGSKSLSLGEKAANALTKNMRGPLANATHAGIRLLGGVGEENLEEVAGWGLDPFIKEFSYGRNVRTRQAQQMMRDQSNSLRSNITNEDDARAVAAYLSSDDFLEQQVRTYMDSGIGKEEARDLAENMRDYLDASLSGDTDRMADIEASLSKKLSGRSVKDILKEDLSLSELKDTIESTTLLTATTGLPGTVTTTARGAAIKEQLGTDGIRALAKTAEDFEDGEMQLKAKAMSDRLDAGKDITNTQAYDLAVGVQEQYNKDADRQQTAYQTAQKTIKSEKLVTPYRVSRDGDIQMDEVTDKTYQSTAKSAKSAIETFVENSDGKESLTDTEIDRGSRAIAGFKTGVFTVDDANELNFRNTAVRSAFEKETGVDLSEYVVKGKDGQIDIPATNTATKNALFAQAADNLVATAQAETANWVDNTKGEVVTQISKRMGAQGLVDLQYVLNDVDERDRSSYMMTANMADLMYQQGRNLGVSWDAVKADAKRLAPGVAEEKLREMYEAGRFDRDRSSDKARGQQIQIGEKIELKKNNEAPTGQVIVETSAPVKGSVIRTFTELARNLGVDIHLVDHFTDKDGKVLKNVNGEYIDGNIFINVNSDFEKNMGFIFMHEVTHHLKMYAPEQYKALENLVREKWFKYDSAQMQSEIAKTIETYAKHGQKLTEEQALEEIIADAAHEFLTDRNFAREIANEDATLAQAVLTSIRTALRMLRSIMSPDDLDETHMNTLFSQLDILDEAERLWLDAYKQAVRNNAAVEVDRLQNQIYEEGRQSLSNAEMFMDYRLNKRTHAARWTNERIDRLIRENGAIRDDYSQAYAVLMRPRDYLKLTLPDEELELWNERSQSGESETFRPLNEEDLAGESQTPFLQIESAHSLDGGAYGNTVFGHEGRHRMRALMEAGIESVPVVIRDIDTKYSKKHEEKMILRSQVWGADNNSINNNARVDVYNLVPIKESNRDELIQKFGGDAQVRFSVSDSDYMDAVNRGDMETAQRMVDEAAKEAGYTEELFHGTHAQFTSFDLDKSRNGNYGYGIYVGENWRASEYGDEDSILRVYVKTDNLATSDDHKIKASAFQSAASKLNIDPKKTYKRHGITAAEYVEFKNDEKLVYNLQDWASSPQYYGKSTTKSAPSPSEILSVLKETTGYDGINRMPSEIILWDNTLLKSADPVTYDDNGDVIPLSERFNQSNPDIRYSIADTDSEGNAITEAEATVLHDIGPNVRFSMTTENETQAKATFRAGKGEFRGFKNEMSGRELRTKLINDNFPEDQADAIVKAIDSFMDATGEFLTDKDGLRMKYQFIGWDDLESGTVSVRRDKNGKIRSVNFSAMKKNDEYPVNFDFSTVCNKRISFTKVIEEIAKAHDAETGASVFSEIKLTPDNMWKINEALKAEGIDTACLGCFVESRRYHIDTFFQNVEDRWNKPVREARRKLGLPEEDYFNFSKEEVPGEQWSAADDNWGDYGRAKAFKGAPLARTQALMNEIVKAGDVDSPLLKLIRPSDLLTPEGFEGFRKLSNAKIDMVGQIKSMYGAGVPKEILGFTPYNSEIALLPKNYKKTKMEKYLKSIGGIRIQSFSDFMIEHVYDHFQLIADAAYRKLPIHAYTKVIAYAKIFGLTGAKINMSVMFDVKNSKQWAEDLGISEENAKQYADKYQGLRFVTETPAEYKTAYKNANTDEKLKKKYDKYISEGATEAEARRKTADWAVRPYRPITLEGKKGYLTYLVSDADYVNEQYQRMYNQYISEGLSEAEAERKANSNKPFEQSINYREAKALQDQDGYRENVGIIGVAFGDEHLRMMMDDENVRYIIPYHSSNLPVVVSNKTNLKVARDYSDRQNTYKAESWTIDGETYNDLKSAYADFKKSNKGEAHPARAFFAEAFKKNLDAKFGEKVEGSNTGAFDVYKSLDTASEISDVSERYLEDCIENNYIPVFHEFADSPGYYKMLFDFMVADDNGSLYPQHEVRNNYPGVDVDAKAEAGEAVTDNDLSELKKVIEEGAKAQNDKLQRWQDRKENVMQDLLSREGEHSIIADSNINSVRYGTEDYTNPKTGEGIPKDVRMSISEDLDEPYMAAVNAGNMEEAQKYVEQAAERAGYNRLQYHQTQNIFTEFDIEHGGNSDGERLFPYGIFTKKTNADIGIEGSIQMPLFVKARNVLTAKDRDEMISILPQEYRDIVSRITDLQAKYESTTDDLEWDMIEALEEYYEAHPDIEEQHRSMNVLDMMEAQKSIPYDEYQRLQAEYDAIMSEWEGQELDLIAQARAYVTAYLRANGYDGFEVDVDAGTLGRTTDTLVLLDRNQAKSADTVTYAEDGSVIPLSERFDPTNNDIRYSMSTEDADGNVLTTNQMDYFKNSQARDEQGRLIPVYHATRTAGFTVFDPTMAFDEVSISFTNDIDFALNYASEDGDIDDFQEAYDNRYGMEEVYSDLDHEVVGHYKVYLNMENPLVLEGDYLDEMSIYEWPVYAKDNGYDGVIYRDFDDIGSDIYQVFSSSQIKDTRNENPTENPDIRYSITEDEGKSKKDYDHATDMSYEELLMYEDMIANASESSDIESAFGKAFDGEKVSIFYSALTEEVGMVFDDEILEEGRMRMAKSKADFWSNLNTKWQERWVTKGEVLDTKSVKTNVRNLIRGVMNNSDTDRQYKTELVNKTLMDMRVAYQLMKQGRTDIASALLYHSALRMITDVDFIQDDTEYQEYKGIRDYLRGEPITVSDDYWQGKAFQQFRKEHYGTLKLRKGDTGNIGEVYAQLENLYPHIFSEAERSKNGFKDGEEDLLQYIGFVTEQNMQPFMEAYSSEYCADWAFEIADDLYEIMENGEGVTSLADRYKEKYDAKAKAMKTRHAEAILRVRKQKQAAIDALKEQYNERLDEQKNRYNEKLDQQKEQYSERLNSQKVRARDAIRKEREKFRQQKQDEKERTKERRLHSKYFDSIVKSHKTLSDRLLTNTKDKHIPEQYKKDLAELLAAFDLQTVASKKLEIRNGLYYRQNYQSKKTIRMKALQETLLNIQADSQLFYVNDSITEIIDRLLGKNAEGKTDPLKSVEGRTIDELTASELKDIDNLLKALIHEFNNYESVRVGAKRQQAADIGTAQIDSCLDHAGKFGEGLDYQNFLGALDNILNLDEVTPAYMFRQIDPQNNGIGMMFKELRRSFGKYVRNQNQLNEWMDEIIGEYNNKGRLWNKYGSALEEWRISTRAKEFQLTNGNVKLTPAQMMSIYCLSHRQQAYDHMTGAGIVVQPVSFQAKIASDLRKRANYALPIILTDADIKLITSKLTPDQIKVADKLQELMATKMAEWGNEASMSVMGIRLFEDPDYFPIKSDKAALEKDFSAEQFMDCIRNFGFTKAVQPGARNAIAIGDIFDVVAEHCNNMNLYNAYSESMNDFMKVYNFHAMREDGSDYSVEQAIAHAYSKKATTFITSFMKDLNGNVSKERTTGIEQMLNDSLGKAKKASVFANGRVALQQPTALVRAFAVINPKYLKGVNIADVIKGVTPMVKKEAMDEMFEHSPIALWKSWGYYDINMGKSIEDLMMNNGSWAEDRMTNIYGTFDNATWLVIWQMCKNEVEDKHKDVEVGSDEYWELVSERMDEVVDLTQVVDSPFHRSHAMRSKNTFTKMATAFMAEPTLTFNMVRDGLRRAKEELRLGNKGKAGKIFGRTVAVFALSAGATAAAAAIWDAVRGKDPGDDDDKDKSFFDLWYANMLENLKDNINLLNNIYYVKDVVSMFQGWDQRNLGLQGWKHLADAKRQLCGDRVSSNLTWYENALAGIGYLSGIPFKTMMNDGKAIFKMFGMTTPKLLQDQLDKLDSLGQSTKDMNSGKSSSSGVSSSKKSSETREGESKSTSVNLWTYDNAPFHIEDGSLADKFLNHFGVNLTSAEIAAIENAEAEKKRDAKIADIKERTADLTGEAKTKKVWSMVTSYAKEENNGKSMSEFIHDGDYNTINRIKEMYIKAGGDPDYFKERVFATSKTELKKTISADNTEEQIEAQQHIKDYLLQSGMSEAELSEIAYKSYTKKDLQVAIRIGDADAAVTELRALLEAGLSDEDFYRIWDNRNRINIAKYRESGGKYADRLKSTGTYNWPINGTITSNFGHRSSPGGIGSTNHQGLDIAGSMGQPVTASDGGVVIMAKWYGGAGKTVQIQHDDGTITQYSHLSWWEPKVGDVVAQGQEIGKVGSTGNSTGPHLHFGVMKNGNYVDPLDYLNKKS